MAYCKRFVLSKNISVRAKRPEETEKSHTLTIGVNIVALIDASIFL